MRNGDLIYDWYIDSDTNNYLVGGFNPFEKY